MKLSKDHKGITVFYSYASADKELRDQLANHLIQLKRDELINEWHDQQILAGSDRVQAIDQAIHSASLILLLVSSDFLASETCYQIEMEQAMARHQRGDACVIPIILRPCDWQRSPFAHLQCLPRNNQPVTTWSNLDEAFADVVAGVRSAIENCSLPKVSAKSTARPSVWNIPYPRNPFFMGREDLLSHIHTQLQRGQPMALSQHPQAISGLGGIGKTQLAVEYAYRFGREYQAVLWAHAESRETLVSSYVALAVLLDLPERDVQEHTNIVQAVKRWLSTHSSWLLILDNADELALVPEFLPPVLGGHLLLTTRAQAMGRLAHRIEVETFSAEQSVLFLLKRAGLLARDATLSQISIEERELATQITQELGGLPLALDQAGGYLEETGYGLAEYQQIYQQHHAALLKERRSLIADHPHPVATTWSLSFQRVQQKNPAAADLLRLCAYLAPDAIPEEIITQGASHLGSLLEATAADPFLRGQAIEVLRAYSLVSRDPVTRSLSIHRLVQAVLRDGQPIETEKQWMQRAVLAVNEIWPSGVLSIDQRMVCERCLPHALLCTTWIMQEQMTFPEAADLLSCVGDYLRWYAARYTEAEPLLQHALVIREKIFGTEHLKVAKDLEHLANLYAHQGKPSQFKPLRMRALAIREQHLDAEHLDAAKGLRNLICLATLYYFQGILAQAESLYLRALAICEQEFDANYDEIAECANGLALIYKRQGKFVQAEPLYQRALAIYEQHSDASHPKNIYLENLGSISTELGRYVQAESLLKRSLAAGEQLYGVMHPYIPDTLDSLALLYKKQGKYEQAEPLYLRALSIREQVWGPEHLTVAQVLTNLAALYHAQGKYEQAQSFNQKVLHVWEQQLASNPNYAVAYFLRAYIYLRLRKSENACADFAKYSSLQPGNVNGAWMVVYASFSKQCPGIEIAERLEAIAALDPQRHFAHVCRGVALGLRGKLQEGLTELEQALHLEPRSEDALFWKGMICAYLDHYATARESIEQALQAGLPPILLTPLFWLEQDSPQFYQEYAKPLLKRYELT